MAKLPVLARRDNLARNDEQIVRMLFVELTDLVKEKAPGETTILARQENLTNAIEILVEPTILA